jgi:replicative DNA helicase
MEFKKKGGRYKSLCCFHADTDPSLTISEDKPVWHCFGCRQGGNLVKFVELKHGINRVQAINIILQNMGVNTSQFLDDMTPEDLGGYNILKVAQSYFLKCAITSQTYKEYFTKKGYTSTALIIQEGVGYCDSVDNLVAFLLKEGFTDKEIWTYDLMNQMFNQSVVFTIYNAAGNINHFKCRSFGEVKFSTGKSILYDSNLMLGIHSLQSKSYVIFVEGDSDWLALKMAGYNALGMGGLKINTDILDKLNLYDVVDVYYWVDGDQAGWQFLNDLAKQYGKIFCSRNLSAKAIFIEGSDPDELVLSGFNVQNALDHADIMPIYYIDQYLAALSTTPDEQKYYALIRSVAKISKDFDRLTVDYVIRHLHMKTGFAPEAIDDELARFINDNLSDYKSEQYLITYLLQHSDAIINNAITNDWFNFKAFKMVFSLIIEKKANIVSVNSLAPQWVLPHISQLPIVDETLIDDVMKNVRDLYQRRSVCGIGRNLLYNNRSFEDGVGYLNESLLKLYGIYQAQAMSVDNILGQIITECRNKQPIKSMKLGAGWKQTDTLLHGVVPKKLIYIMGNTGHGKTTLALNWVVQLSIEQSYKGLIISGEMDGTEVTERITAISSGISATNIIIRNLTDADIAKLVEVQQKLNMGNIQIHTTMEVDHIFNLIRYAKLKFGIDYVVLDHLQLVSPAFYMKGMTRTQQLKEVTRRMKVDVCDGLGLPAIILGQLGDDALDDATPQGRRSSESKLILGDADVTIAIKQKNEKEKTLEPVGDIVYHIDKVRYNKGKKVLKLVMDDVNLKISEIGVF